MLSGSRDVTSLLRPLAAVSVMGALALAGCSAADDAPETADTPAATAEESLPEADLEGLPDVIAVVNGEEIALEEFTVAYEGRFQQVAMTQQMTGEELDQDALKADTAESLVNTLLLTQAATEAGFEASDEDIDAMLEDIAAQAGLGSIEELITAFDEQGMSEDELRENAAGDVEIDQFIEAETDIPEPSEDELREQYDALVEQTEAQGDAAQGEIPTFEELRDQLAQQAVMEQQNVAISAILDDLRESGDVTINL